MNTTDVQIPIWLAGVQNISQELNKIFVDIPDKNTENYRHLITQINHLNIQDLIVKEQYQQFYSQCYLPTYDKI